MKTAEQIREEAAQIAEGLEKIWRGLAVKQQEYYDQAWIGGTLNRKNAETLNAAADGVAAIAKKIRGLALE